MYGAPKVGYGTEVVQSFNALIDAIKRRQVLRPRSLFAMCLAGVDFAVKLLPNGFVEVDGDRSPRGCLAHGCPRPVAQLAVHRGGFGWPTDQGPLAHHFPRRTVMRASLKRIVSHPELSGAALKAFTDYPTLEEITVQFLHFVPPWIVIGSESLAERTIRNALMAYEKSKGGRGCTVGQRRYIETIAESAKVLSSLRVSVKNSSDQWDIWNYDQPLIEYMSHRKRWAVQIRERETPIAAGPVMLKLLASISSTQELESAEIDMTGLFNGSALQ